MSRAARTRKKLRRLLNSTRAIPLHNSLTSRLKLFFNDSYRLTTILEPAWLAPLIIPVATVPYKMRKIDPCPVCDAEEKNK